MIYAYKPISIPLKKAVVGFFVSMVLLFLEIMTVQTLGWDRDNDMYFFLMPATFFLFYLSTHIELKPNKAYKYLRNLSILMYCAHYFVYRCVESGYSFLGKLLQIEINDSLFIYVTVVLITFVISHTIIKLNDTKRFAWLKVLYS